MNPEVKLNTDSQHPATVEVKASAEAGRADGEPAAADTATAREAGAGKGTGRRRRRRAELRELESELKRERYRARYIYTIRSTIFTLITVAAVAVLIATLWMPVLQIYGSSMTPTLEDGDVVVSRKTGALEQGDVIAWIFVMGDHRSVSIDSRNSAVGCIARDQIVGALVLRIWPLKMFGLVR